MTTEQAERIDNLEMQLAFQEEIIEGLNNEVIELNSRIIDMDKKLEYIISKLKSSNSSMMASEEEETPPPHY